MVEISWGLLSFSIFGIGLCTLFGFLGNTWWIFDLFSNFRLQYSILLSILFVVFLAGGQYSQAIATAVFTLINLGFILPIYQKIPPHFQSRRVSRNPGPSDVPVYRALLVNVLQSNQEYIRVQELIRATNPDMILLIEINRTWVEQLQPVLVKYPHSVKPLREDNYGLGLFSKFPFTSSSSVEFGDAKVPSVIAQLDLNGQSLTIIGTHPPPPKRGYLSRQRDEQLMNIARSISTKTGPILLMGDLNITSWSPHFQNILRTGKLKDSRQGWGLQPSWPVDRPLFLVPIDHILVTEDIVIHHRRRGPYTGSDHFPILVDFAIMRS